MSEAVTDFLKIAAYGFTPFLIYKAVTAGKKPDADGPPTNVTQPRPLRQYACGTLRVKGARNLRRSTKNFYAQCFSYPEGPVASYGRAWLNEDEVKIVSNVAQSTGGGRYETGRAKVYERLGNEIQTAYSQLTAVPAYGWSSSHRGDGVPSNALICEHGKKEDAGKQFPAGAQTELFREAAYLAYDWRKDSTAGGSGAHRRYADGATQAEKDEAYATWEPTGNPVVWFVNIEWRRYGADWAKRFAPILDHLTTHADICDEPIIQRVGWALTTQAQPAGDDAMALTSVEGLEVGSAINVAGQEVTVTSILGLTIHFTPDLSSTVPIYAPVRWINATTISAPRYEVGFQWSSDTPRKEVREWIMGSMDGWFQPDRAGAYVVRAGAYEAPTYVFGRREILEWDFDPGPQIGEAPNTLTVGFTDPAIGYKPSDTDAWINEDDITLTGRESVDDFSPVGVHNNSQARRLAKIRMDQNFAPRVTIRTPLSARRAFGHRFIGIKISEQADLNNAVFEVTEPPRIELSESPSIVWVGKLATAARYTWNAATEEGDGPVSGFTSAQEELVQPSVSTVEVFSEYAGASRTYRLRIEITNPDPDRDDLTWFYRWRVQGAVAWVERPGGDIDPMVGIILETDFVPSESLLDVQVAYQTGGGSQSDWSATALADTTADFLTTEGGDVLVTEAGAPILTEE